VNSRNASVNSPIAIDSLTSLRNTIPVNTLLTILSLLGLSVILLHIALPFLLRNLISKSIIRRRIDPTKIYLTFDDGPDPIHTPRILDILSEHKIKGTFFVIGESVEKHPEILKRIQAEGHAIGSHSYYHSHAWKSNPWTSFKDFQKGHKTLVQQLTPTNLWRPPYGKANLLTLAYSLINKLDLIYWTNDPQDYDPNLDQDQLTDRLLRNSSPGDIILLHDGRRTQSATENITPGALERFLSETSLNKNDFTTIS
jgi:peptidoglycan-N-acetylglucosamine deacetylase